MIEESDIIEWRKGRISKFIPPNLHQVTFHCQNGEIENLLYNLMDTTFYIYDRPKNYFIDRKTELVVNEPLLSENYLNAQSIITKVYGKQVENYQYTSID